MSRANLKIGLAGCGKMGSAMVRAWLDRGLVSSLDILDPNGLPDFLQGNKLITGFTDEAAFARNADTWDALILAIKPQMLQQFAASMPAMPQRVPILSIMAGQTILKTSLAFGGNRPVIRAMPNTPAAIGKGATVACACPETTPAQRAMVQSLLGCLGLFEWLDDESLLDAVTALSGSGPAYVFYLIEAMAKAGIKAGLPADMAMKLARQTVIGAAALAETDADIAPAKLRENVTSPNGTTAAALEILMDGRLQDILTHSVEKACRRSKEISEQ